MKRGSSGQISEVGIIARLVAICRIQADGLAQIGDGFGKVSGQAIQRCHAVPDEIQLGGFLGQRIEVFARSDVIAHIHQRDGIIELLFGCLERSSRPRLNLLSAGVQVDAGTVGNAGLAPVDNLLKNALALSYL